ncbi:MAG: hypothetical protein QM727_06835 [Niabella sp.]
MRTFIALLFTLIVNNVIAQKVENIFVITTDGLRWQEVFGGMDADIAKDKRFNEHDSAYIFKKYWQEDAEQRRAKLMPFFWSVLKSQGQLYGNRLIDSKVDVANKYWFSYPGYNELLTGYPDDAVNSNSYPPNKNVTVLEFLNKQPKFKTKVAAFAAWEAFARILNKDNCGYPVVSSFDTVQGKNLTPVQRTINQMLLNSYQPWLDGECLDVFTHYSAMEYVKVTHPKVMYIGYGDTDEWAHAGKYRTYLDAVHQFDKWVGEIWQYIQSQPQYRNKTALFISTDHGRGDEVKSQWTSHGSDIPGASQTWLAVMGPGISPKGEVKGVQLHTEQFAQTIAQLLGTTFTANHPIGKSVKL